MHGDIHQGAISAYEWGGGASLWRFAKDATCRVLSVGVDRGGTTRRTTADLGTTGITEGSGTLARLT
jgi:hypothetical protein